MRYSNIFTALLGVLFVFSNSFAQDGAALFKAKCNTCHIIGKNSTGPNLKGVKQKWSDAGEENLLHDWVKNSSALIASGRSKVAQEAQNFSPTVMPSQDVKPEEIDAILTYIDTYEPPVAVQAASTSDEATVETVPNYKRNLSLFYFLMTLVAVQLIAILILSNSIKMTLASDYYQKKLVKKARQTCDTAKKLLPLLILCLFSSMDAHALTFVPNSEEGMPWLQIENVDLYVLFGLNVILLAVVFYIRSLFKHLISFVDDRPKALPKEKQVKEKSTFAKMNVILTDAVPIEQEKHILLHHEYDGIRELDNNLPPWWLVMFFMTAIFALGYMFHYHVFKTGDLQTVEYNKSMARAKYEVQQYLDKMAMNVDETNATRLESTEDLAQGKAIFSANCVTCHNTDGQGDIGPNLTDNHWFYSNDIKDVFKTIKMGTAKGMPEHQSKLNPIQIQQVASYVLSLPYKAGKEPEGTEIVLEAVEAQK